MLKICKVTQTKKNTSQWRTFCKSNKKPDNIPASPNRSYKNQGWVSWYDWLINNNKI